MRSRTEVPITGAGEGCGITRAVPHKVMTISRGWGERHGQKAQPEGQRGDGDFKRHLSPCQTQYLCPSSSRGRCRQLLPCSSCHAVSS